tara:strand:+ start:349 stop:519 length:171 start_codon:yes stop_codon:yes gene_type:complete
MSNKAVFADAWTVMMSSLSEESLEKLREYLDHERRDTNIQEKKDSVKDQDANENGL